MRLIRIEENEDFKNKCEIKLVTDGGQWVEHNMPCAVCLEKHAVYDLHEGVFYPCWSCQNKWQLKKVVKSFWKRIF